MTSEPVRATPGVSRHDLPRDGTGADPAVDAPDLRGPRVLAVHRDPEHRFSKPTVDEVQLVEGIGVLGDAHAGRTVQHLFQQRREPDAPNLRQVHLIHAELFDHLREQGFDVLPGQLGENITTRGLDLLSLPAGTRLTIGDAVVTLTGLRNPCSQINGLQPGLMRHLMFKDADGATVRLAGVMGVVSASGIVRAGQAIGVRVPEGDRLPLAPV